MTTSRRGRIIRRMAKDKTPWVETGVGITARVVVIGAIVRVVEIGTIAKVEIGMGVVGGIIVIGIKTREKARAREKERGITKGRDGTPIGITIVGGVIKALHNHTQMLRVGLGNHAEIPQILIGINLGIEDLLHPNLKMDPRRVVVWHPPWSCRSAGVGDLPQGTALASFEKPPGNL